MLTVTLVGCTRFFPAQRSGPTTTYSVANFIIIILIFLALSYVVSLGWAKKLVQLRQEVTGKYKKKVYFVINSE